MSVKVDNISEKGEDVKVQVVQVLKCQTSETISTIILDEIKEYMKSKKGDPEKVNISKLSKQIHKKITSTHGNAWTVIIGSHFTGMCIYEENHYLEVQIGKNRIVVYKSRV